MPLFATAQSFTAEEIDRLGGTKWRMDNNLEWFHHDTKYVTLTFFKNSPMASLTSYFNSGWGENKTMYTNVALNEDFSYSLYIYTPNQSEYPILIEVRNNILIMHNSKVWPEKPDFIFRRVQ